MNEVNEEDRHDIVKNNITYSTSHAEDREKNKEVIHRLLKKYEKTMRRLANYDTEDEPLNCMRRIRD